MYNIYKTLYLGSAIDYEQLEDSDKWFIIHMAKEPYHRELADYKDAELSKNDPNYYWVQHTNRMAFNLTDYGGNVNLVPKKIIDKALLVIDEKISAGTNLLVHCTFGRSRSASIVLLYLSVYTELLTSKSLIEAEEQFLKIYPKYKPSPAMRDFLIKNWQKYMGTNNQV